MISTVVTNIAVGILSNFGYDAIIQDKESITSKINDAYRRAEDKFYSKYDRQYGDILNSFLERQSNIDMVVNSLFYGNENITYKEIDIKNFNGYNDGTKKAVIEFIAILYAEMHTDYTLDKIITEKKFMIESKINQEEIKEGISENNRTIERLKTFFTDALNKSLAKFREGIPFDIALGNQSLNIASIELPMEIKNGVERKDTVSAIIESVENKTWYHLKGEVGSGKTQLLILLSKKYKGEKLWINVKGLKANQVVATINSSLAFQTHTRANNNTYSWYEKAISKLTSNDVIIIDDIPKIIDNENLADLLMKIAIKCKTKGVKLFTSGSNNVGLKVKQSLDTNLIKTEVIPPFNQNEIEELLSIKGAPDNSRLKLSQWISAISKNNPSIINLVADYLSTENWNISLDVFEKINSGLYMEELISEIQNTLIANIKDVGAKELLYRLTVIDDQFDNRYVQEIANVDPMIHHPFEKITDLLGYWITKKEQNYSVTPLISKIGELNLDDNTKCKVHSRVAKLIAEKKVLDPLEIIRLISHLLSAKEFNQAGYIFIHALQEMNIQEIEEDYWGFTLVWKSTALPQEMDYELQVKIRMIQLMVLSKMEENNVDFIIGELEKLLLSNEINEDEGSTRNIACFLLASHFMERDRKKSLIFMKEALTTYDSELLGSSDLEINLEEMIWFSAPLLSDREEIDCWIDLVNSLSKEQIEKALQSELSNECSLFLANRIWFNEFQRKEDEREWEVVFKQFEAMESLAKRSKMDILNTCIIRAKVIVYGEHLGDLDKGEALVKTYLLENELTVEGDFLIKSILGKQFLLKKQYAIAAPYLQKALEVPIDSFPLERVDALMDLSLCEGYCNSKEKASHFIEKAIKITNLVDYIPDIQRAIILGEYAVSLWEEGDIEGAYFPLQESAELLFRQEDIDRSWKCLFSVLGHVLGYYSSIAKGGAPPEFIYDGDGYQKPTRGIFQSENDELEDIYDSRKMTQLTTLLYFYAEAIEEYSEAKKWIFRGYDWIRDNKAQNNIVAVHLSSLPSYLIFEKNFTKALDVSIEASNLIYASMLQGKTELKNILENIEIDTIFAEDKESKDTAYLKGVSKSIVQIALYVCNLHVKGSVEVQPIIQSALDTIKMYKEKGEYIELWNKIEEVFSMLLNPEENLYKKVKIKDFEDVDDSFKVIVQGLSYIIASINGPSNQALDLHLKSILWIEQFFENDDFGTEKILNPFYKNFWLQRYILDRFSFQNTEDIDVELQRILNEESSNSTKEILQIMNLGFNIQVDSEIFKS